MEKKHLSLSERYFMERHWEIMCTNESDYSISDCSLGVFVGTETDVRAITNRYNDIETRSHQMFGFLDTYRYWYREYREPFTITKTNALERLKDVSDYDIGCAIPKDCNSLLEYDKLFEGEIK